MTLSLLLFLLLTALLPFLRFTLSSAATPITTKRPKIIGHRGAAGLAPENTIASIKRAFELGVSLVEFDVHVTKDHQLVVMHDSNVKRTTDGTGEIESLTVEDLKRLDAGSWFDAKFAGERIPTFQEVLTLASTYPDIQLLVELKWPENGIYEDVVDLVTSAVHKNGIASRVILQTFDVRYLDQLRTAAKGIQVHQLLFGQAMLLPVYQDRNFRVGKFTPVQNASSVNIFFMYVDRSFISAMHKNGLEVFIYTVNSRRKIFQAINLGVDGIITDFPDVALRVTAEMNNEAL